MYIFVIHLGSQSSILRIRLEYRFMQKYSYKKNTPNHEAKIEGCLNVHKDKSEKKNISVETAVVNEPLGTRVKVWQNMKMYRKMWKNMEKCLECLTAATTSVL